jgi:hypothetical protein
MWSGLILSVTSGLISDGRDGRPQTDGLTTPEEKDRKKKKRKKGVAYVT